MKKQPEPSYREELFAHAAQTYGTQPEYLWRSFSGYAVLRHQDNRKWYALIMDIPKSKLGMSGDGAVDLLELKTDPILSGSLINGTGIRPAYHMKQGN